MTRTRDEELLLEAVALAQRGRTWVEPNPRVGAIASRAGVVVGSGWHETFGGPHAEVTALAEARGRGERPDTVHVTLEPCSTPQGSAGKKTPPCTEALRAAGVRRVVFGAADPDPRHAGRAAAELRAAGIAVEGPLLPGECGALLGPFQRGLALDRPWTLAKWAMTLDGKIATVTGSSRWVSGEESRRRAHALRASCDAVVVGWRTVEADDPELTVRHVPGRQPVRVVVDPEAAIDDDCRLLRTARAHPLWLLVAEDADAAVCGRLADAGARVVHCPRRALRRLDLASAWRELRARGMRRVLVEGGGGLVAELLAARCVDQLVAFVAPKLVGGRAAPTPVGGDGFASMDQALRVADLHVAASGEDLLVDGYLQD
ncbi:MAG: bifunctional diaminohydroxyphosphoribosylaminopyrimidine deaminase/5-amino-6-(5-phosphoribosylamino)uracil reductase RibD [Planctomycetes bacterium]|nr:bifunctional diaminohydroxyphosphoribosylaminopyrimidine deaminase/5-amino-6-(5-phosphoribosylamino)uracil reductase RibD [Planctomycetota bacterium]